MQVEREPLIITNYVVTETTAVLQRRLGLDSVRVLHEVILPIVTVAWVGNSLHQRAVELLLAMNRRQVSLVGCASFLAMRGAQIRRVFTLDSHFAEQGFEVVPEAVSQ